VRTFNAPFCRLLACDKLSDIRKERDYYADQKMGQQAPALGSHSTNGTRSVYPSRRRISCPGSAQGPTATGESIQYINVTVNPPAGAHTSAYDNSVYAANAKSWRSPFKFTYRLRNSNAPIINADNYAQADEAAAAIAVLPRSLSRWC
jgi:hypothetical protein